MVYYIYLLMLLSYDLIIPQFVFHRLSSNTKESVQGIRSAQYGSVVWDVGSCELSELREKYQAMSSRVHNTEISEDLAVSGAHDCYLLLNESDSLKISISEITFSFRSCGSQGFGFVVRIWLLDGENGGKSQFICITLRLYSDF